MFSYRVLSQARFLVVKTNEVPNNQQVPLGTTYRNLSVVVGTYFYKNFRGTSSSSVAASREESTFVL